MQPLLFGLFFVASLFTATVNAIHFDLPAFTIEHAEEGTKCFSQYVPDDTLVLAVVNIGEGYNQRVNLEVIKIQASRKTHYWNSVCLDIRWQWNT